MISLINMPFASIFQPSLALSQFKAQLTLAGLDCRLHNLNFEFARRIGIRSYEAIARRRGVDTQLGEWLFANYAWRDEVDLPLAEFIQLCGVNLTSLHAGQTAMDWLNTVRDKVVPRYIEHCCQTILAQGEPTVVAFSCVFYQTVAALALARRLKELRPSLKTVFGGACFHSVMGEELIGRTDWIDVVSTGEADDIVVELFRTLAAGREPVGMHGILYRNEAGQVSAGPPMQPISSPVLEEVPTPDFDDFIKDLDTIGLASNREALKRIFLPFESSRGCWWGQKKQCAFCGLNGQGMTYRQKSPQRVRALLSDYASRYPIRRYFATDNNMPLNFYRELLPDLSTTPLPGTPAIFYEIKTNVRREWIKVLSDAGVRYIQPGIESLSTRLLKCLRKGVSAIKNVHLLKLCRTYHVLPMWNFLVSIPGEHQTDYDQQVALIKKIVHYYPPYSNARIMQLHRFSPYFESGDQFVANVRPKPWYRGLFPESRFALSRLAYYFDAEWKDTLGRTHEAYLDIDGAIKEWIGHWRDDEELPALSYDVMAHDGLTLLDTRQGRNREWRLDPLEGLVYKAIDDPLQIDALTTRLAGVDCPPDRLQGILHDFVAQELAITDESGYFLALALPNTSTQLSLEVRRIFLKHDESRVRDTVE